MPDITCPVCGEVNSADQEFCQYCQSRLQPLTGPLKGADAPIQPGQMPTKKNTADLEPILPQWLRDARDKARKTAEEQAAQAAKQPTPQSNVSSSDLLAGLQSQKGEDEEETPDWLANITGVKPKSKKTEAESTEVHWVELGKPDEFMRQDEEPNITATQEPTETADEGELPAWLAGMQPSEEGGVDELTAWLREAQSQEAEPPAPSGKPAPFTEAGPGSMDEEAPALREEPLPDWLKNLQADQPAAEESPQTEFPAEIETDADWLKKLQESEEKSVPPISTETPSWLKEAPSEQVQDETPAWLRSSQAFTADEAAAQEAEPGELPEWLKATAPISSPFEEQPAAPLPAEPPDWLAALQADTGLAPEPGKTEEAGSPAFTEDSLLGESADAIFTEMPDWLSSVGGGESEAAPAAPSQAAEPLAPGELPSWVQAMRPVEASLPQEGSVRGDEAVETRGALAGLQGVLPAVPGMGPTSKPKAYSIKLDASEEQLTHATLLEQILAAETAPEPIASFAPLASQRGLRWFLAILLLTIITGVLFLQRGVFALPTGETNDLRDARLIMEALPASAPVLVVIDYEPALAGEMEAVAAPLLEHGIILRQPVLTFISTSPTGGLLAEHLMSGPLQGRGYQRGTNYLNLGYLPGGLTGVRAFAQDPVAAAPFAMESTFLNPVVPWETGQLKDVKSLSQFAAMIVVTDNAESGRTWIEQTAFHRGASPIIMVASAQTAPMIQPYYDSRQVSAVVSGLYGGAIVEQSNGDLPSLAQDYWDSFSIGLLLAVVMIVIGGLGNVALGLRDRVLEGK